MRKFIKSYLAFCALYYAAFFGFLGFLSMKDKAEHTGYQRGVKASAKEIAGLKMALEALAKKAAPPAPATPTLVVSN